MAESNQPVTNGTSDKTFVDSNVLIYAHDVDAGRKHEIAKGLLRDLWVERTGVLSTQVLHEFYVNVTRRFGRRCRNPQHEASSAPTSAGASIPRSRMAMRLSGSKTRRASVSGTPSSWPSPRGAAPDVSYLRI